LLIGAEVAALSAAAFDLVGAAAVADGPSAFAFMIEGHISSPPLAVVAVGLSIATTNRRKDSRAGVVTRLNADAAQVVTALQVLTAVADQAVST
jgi:hypothetical protein